MQKCLLTLLLCFIGVYARAQYQVSGTVMDQTGETLIGATIREVGDNNNGTITDFNGKYTIKVSKKNAQLSVSYVGYEDQTVSVQGKTIVDIVLKTSEQTLEEVVVVGYGTQKKESVTGAITSVNQKVLKQTPVANITNALVGKVTGLTAIQQSGEPGYDGATIFVRGKATFTGSTNPLILVDGVERSFGDIDANEIESVSILKDASATAVYGVRGANGVVLVTTKRGEVGAPKVSLTYSYGVQTPTRLTKYCDSYDVLTLFEEGLSNDGKSSQYTPETIAKYRDRSNPTYQYLYPNVDWTEELLKDNTGQMQANVNVSGGGSLFRYFVSVGYMNQDGIYKYSDMSEYNTNAKMERYNFRTNIDVDIRKDVKLMLNLGGIIQDLNFPGTSASDLFYAIKTRLPYYYPMTNPDGSIAEYANSEGNPYAMLTKTGYAANKSTTLNATAGVTWDMSRLITQGLSLTARLSFDADNYRNVSRSRGYNAYKFSIAETETDLSKGTYANVRTGSEALGYGVTANGTRYTLLEAMLNYSRSFGEHNVTGLLMYNQSSKLIDATDAIKGLPFRKQGIVGRVTYNYAGKYFGEFNMGYNGSENFIQGHRMGFFPAVSLSYVLSEENFLKNTSWLDLLKFRFSYGLVGNDDNGSRFLYQSQWTTGWKTYTFGHTGNGLNLGGAGVYSTGNESVTWEKAKKLNIGLDLDLWKSAIHLTVDVFHERRTDILCTPGTIPSTIGVTSLPSINAGIVTNKGFEIELEHRKNFRNWGYSVKGNFSYAKNKIISADEPDNVDKPWQRRAGTSIDEMYGYIAEGLFQTWDEINDPDIAKTTASNLQPGDIRYKDLNGDGVINDDDRGYLGKNSTPDKIVGLALSGNWKNFDFSVLFQAALGGNTWFTGSAIWPFESKASVSQDVLNNYWSTNNTAEQNANVFYPRLSSDHSDNNYIESTYWLKSSDYLRLKNVEIGYRLPKSVNKFLGVEELRLYANAVNLITWDHMKIFDPESPNGAVNYPQMKVFNFGVHVSF